MEKRKHDAPEGPGKSLDFNCLLVRTGKHTVLVETGIGTRMSDKEFRIYDVRKPTNLLKELEKAGVSREEVDIVLNTHLHFDHSGWNLMPAEDGSLVPTFPRARYYVQRGEWDRAVNPTVRR